MESSRSGVASSKENLPFTTFDSTAQDENKAAASKSESMSLKFTIQCLVVVILLNIFLYHTVRYSSAETTNFGDCSHENATLEPSKFTNDLGKLSSDSKSGDKSHGNDHPSAWLLEAVGAYTKKTYVSFSDVTAICANYSERNSPSRCTTNTIASVILLSSSIISLRSELINVTTPHFSNGRPLNPNFDPPALLDMMYPNPSEFPKAVPYLITHTIGFPVHHVGYYCPLSSPCTNPTFSISTHEGIPMLFTFLPSILDTDTEVLKFGFGNATGYHFSTNNFANGGFDILFEKAKSPLLDPKNDYSQMKEEVHCLLSDGLKLPGLFFKVHTHGSREKGLHGAVSPWICNERSEIERMETIMTSEQNMTTCAAAIALRHSKRLELWLLGGSCLGLAGSGLLLSLFSWWLENRQGRIRL
ncbi:uncharacterized protein EAF02_010320 [Botrytis sinoallii]|uniref:uncharacterized protein n=1 Tax=Botrytis sinoallii TaxID=1463999 RepID=UPI00190182FB|nr:uncharacterized protein EAF02_010320 [Botrytis sinoallii]KAF7864352.1 hypothetical protein EAF02_010320 [Botrytis sinoallii]